MFSQVHAGMYLLRVTYTASVTSITYNSCNVCIHVVVHYKWVYTVVQLGILKVHCVVQDPLRGYILGVM